MNLFLKLKDTAQCYFLDENSKNKPQISINMIGSNFSKSYKVISKLL